MKSEWPLPEGAQDLQVWNRWGSNHTNPQYVYIDIDNQVFVSSWWAVNSLWQRSHRIDCFVAQHGRMTEKQNKVKNFVFNCCFLLFSIRRIELQVLDYSDVTFRFCPTFKSKDQKLITNIWLKWFDGHGTPPTFV